MVSGEERGALPYNQSHYDLKVQIKAFHSSVCGLSTAFSMTQAACSPNSPEGVPRDKLTCWEFAIGERRQPHTEVGIPRLSWLWGESRKYWELQLRQKQQSGDFRPPQTLSHTHNWAWSKETAVLLTEWVHAVVVLLIEEGIILGQMSVPP